MDSWNNESNNNTNNDRDVTVTGQFNSEGQQESGYNQDAYGQNQNSYNNQPGYNQELFGQTQGSYSNGYNQNNYNNYNQGNYGAPNGQGSYGQNQNMSGGYGQPYANYNQPSYQGAGYSPIEKEEPVGMGEWLGLLAIATFVPCIGLILVIVWAFGKSEKKSKSNFCKAYLVIALIQLALGMILFIIYGAAMAAAIGSL